MKKYPPYLYVVVSVYTTDKMNKKVKMCMVSWLKFNDFYFDVENYDVSKFINHCFIKLATSMFLCYDTIVYII